MKALLKRIVRVWPWALTINERYDRQTKAVIRKVCKPDSICIDIGCYKGDILQVMMQYAPDAYHYAFEPIPQQFEYLKKTFGKQANIFPFALGNEDKVTTFHHVISNPTYSGLQKRQYKGQEDVLEITVQQKRLDDVIPPDKPIRLIKIDVEGGEYDVLKGAESTLQNWRPFIIFEHGIGGSDKYGVTPRDIYDFLTPLGYKVALMKDFLAADYVTGFTLAEFENQYNKRLNCYFIAIPSEA